MAKLHSVHSRSIASSMRSGLQAAPCQHSNNSALPKALRNTIPLHCLAVVPEERRLSKRRRFSRHHIVSTILNNFSSQDIISPLHFPGHGIDAALGSGVLVLEGHLPALFREFQNVSLSKALVCRLGRPLACTE